MRAWILLLSIPIVTAVVKEASLTKDVNRKENDIFVPDYKMAFDWLKRFNYVNNSSSGDLHATNMGEMIKGPLSVMKKIYKLGDDGELDEKTQNFMLRPRCGNPDKPRELLHRTEGGSVRKKRWAVIPGVDTWVTPGNDFTFPITIGFNNYSSQMSKADQDAGLLFCATRWAQESGISFEIFPEKQVANIFIGFVDALPGQTVRGDVLAEAESPTPFLNPGSSHIAFDSRFKWVAKFAPGQPEEFVSFQDTLCHELGHSLGLDHSEVAEAFMFASTMHRDFERDLHPDDIAGIRSIYGGPNNLVIVNRAPATSLAPPPSITAAPVTIVPTFTPAPVTQAPVATPAPPVITPAPPVITTTPPVFVTLPFTQPFVPRRIQERRRRNRRRRRRNQRIRARKRGNRNRRRCRGRRCRG